MAKPFDLPVDKRCTKCNQIELYTSSHSICSCGGELVPWKGEQNKTNLEHIKDLLRRVSEVEEELNYHLRNLRCYESHSKQPLQAKVRILQMIIIRSHYLQREYKQNQPPVCLDERT